MKIIPKEKQERTKFNSVIKCKNDGHTYYFMICAFVFLQKEVYLLADLEDGTQGILTIDGMDTYNPCDGPAESVEKLINNLHKRKYTDIQKSNPWS